MEITDEYSGCVKSCVKKITQFEMERGNTIEKATKNATEHCQKRCSDAELLEKISAKR